MMSVFVQAIMTLALSGLALYAFLGLFTLIVYWKHRQENVLASSVDRSDLPLVTVQLPLYNERHVIGRLIHAVAALDYPRHRLHIQVLDDSDDDTTGRAATLVQEYRARGLQIELRHRRDRCGY
jgi:cellulose synthase/poly-beta-1,6-N-acetylglucosamine synthase-like glycosyltransferase